MLTSNKKGGNEGATISNEKTKGEAMNSNGNDGGDKRSKSTSTSNEKEVTRAIVHV